MSTQAIPGFDAFLFVEIAAVATKIAEIRDVTLNINHAPIDASTHDDSPWKTNIEGWRDWTIDGEALYFEGDAGQEELLAKILSGASFVIKLEPQDGSGNRQWDGTARMTTYTSTAPNEDAQAVSISMMGVGAISDGTQP